MKELELITLFFSPILICFIPLGCEMLNAIFYDKGLAFFLIPVALTQIVLGIIGILILIFVPLKYFMGC